MEVIVPISVHMQSCAPACAPASAAALWRAIVSAVCMHVRFVMAFRHVNTCAHATPVPSTESLSRTLLMWVSCIEHLRPTRGLSCLKVPISTYATNQ